MDDYVTSNRCTRNLVCHYYYDTALTLSAVMRALSASVATRRKAAGSHRNIRPLRTPDSRYWFIDHISRFVFVCGLRSNEFVMRAPTLGNEWQRRTELVAVTFGRLERLDGNTRCWEQTDFFQRIWFDWTVQSAEFSSHESLINDGCYEFWWLMPALKGNVNCHSLY